VNEPGDGKTPLEHVLDVCVYAPLGFALEARSLLPKFVDRGRNQIVLARVVGKYAVRKGTRATESRVSQAHGHAKGVLRLVGVVPGPDDDAPPATSSNGHHGRATNGGRAPSAREPREPEPTGSADDATPRPSADELAIPDYDALSASQVVPRLESLTGEELEAVRGYEASTRGRKTILNKITQLQSP
jgi:hypothetical protein